MNKLREAGSEGWSRRGFLGAGAAGALSAIAGSAVAKLEPTTTRASAMPGRALGKTGLKVPEVSFGSWNLTNSRLVDAAIDAGMTLIETSPAYQNGRAEEVIGQVLKRRRKDVIVGTAWTLGERRKPDEFLEQLDGSLRRLQTDHVELIRAYDVTRASQLEDEALHEAFERARQAGKVAHLGLSVHARKTQQAILEKAVETGRISYVMAKYNFMEFPHIFEIFARAYKAGMGIIVFKTGAGERQKDMDELRERQKLTVKQAAIAWALSNRHVASVLATVRNFEQIKEFSAAAGKALTTRQSSLLDEYRRRFDKEYCRYCGKCASACPAGVDIDAVMRYAMYDEYYFAGEEGSRLYASLAGAARADRCAGCAGHCRAACPHGLDVQGQLAQAHGRLSGRLA